MCHRQMESRSTTAHLSARLERRHSRTTVAVVVVGVVVTGGGVVVVRFFTDVGQVVQVVIIDVVIMNVAMWVVLPPHPLGRVRFFVFQRDLCVVVCAQQRW